MADTANAMPAEVKNEETSTVTVNDAGELHFDASADATGVLSNVRLAAEIVNATIAQQNAIQMQHAYFQLELATVAKCAELILAIDQNAPDAAQQLSAYRSMMDTFIDQFRRMRELLDSKRS